jgi:hypothetical protein
MKKFVNIFCLCVFAGCSSHLTRYDTYLLNTEPKTLQFKDDKFEFGFLPVPNGIHFKIYNLTNTPAILQWDMCYFIEPDGNSSKALNIDLLGENIETIEKAKYESILPPNGKFARFTTSALNAPEYKKWSAAEINVQFAEVSFLYAGKYRFYNYGRYWPEYKPKDSVYRGNPRTEIRKRLYEKDAYDTITVYDSIHIDKGLERIKNYVLNHNKMGLGLSIKIRDTILDYRFDFRFKEVCVFKKPVSKKEEPKVMKCSSEDNGWEWK